MQKTYFSETQKQASEDDICVVYLSRYQDGGMLALSRFLTSYVTHRPAIRHRLVVLLKGWEGAGHSEDAKSRIRTCGGELMTVPNTGFDWGSYFLASTNIKTDYFCFLNTHSRILHSSWLEFLIRALHEPGVGLAGCTASYSSHVPDFRRILCNQLHSVQFRRKRSQQETPKRSLLTAIYAAISLLFVFWQRQRHFDRFPNPHIRSNAFAVSSKVFSEFCQRRLIPRTKLDALRFESGHESLTHSQIKQGFKCVVVNSKGQVFDIKFAKDARTYSTGDQELLMIEDNQTRLYAAADTYKKRILEAMAWGSR